MTLKEALKRIEELERKVKQLEAAPKEQHTHFHTHPVYQPYTIPIQSPYPQPWQPWVGPTCGAGSMATMDLNALTCGGNALTYGLEN
jgi:hypothetical protein